MLTVEEVNEIEVKLRDNGQLVLSLIESLREVLEKLQEPLEDSGKCPVCGALAIGPGKEFDYTP